ncbi:MULTISPECIES: hypothetical protein [Stenotrophomonas maltophilia group]|uniref:hypothetical protein n=1 Tax=Stenotrophomonas maltophilia group TaxID=995085 RepID=UPI001E2A3414|nr:MULTISPECIES: hypothetical protein [Stenotrophomonas maltophilia group]MDQ4682153.1 hypothetical protein [Stenotrophomonas maltophilia group sp. RNC7]UGB22618.1 hypothetical protein LQ335_05085 [Stenotrophomonas maltophilia]
MDAEHLEYFKAALEGRATVGWNVWFAANQHALAQQLSRPALLRLKFSTLDEAERLLAEAGIVPRSTVGKRYEMYCAQFSPDVVDANGRPLPALWRAAHGGAIGLLADGGQEAGQAKLLAESAASVRSQAGLLRRNTLFSCLRVILIACANPFLRLLEASLTVSVAMARNGSGKWRIR